MNYTNYNKDFLLTCECSSNEHNIQVKHDKEDNLFYLNIFLSNGNFFYRLKNAIKYIFGYKCKYGHFEEIILGEKSQKQLSYMANNLRRKELQPFYEYHTKYSIGFTTKEIKELIKRFPNINKERFNNALNNITAQTIDGNMVIYTTDIETALLCGIENRDIYDSEFD